MRIFTIDAFAEKPFTGNPAAVCILDSERNDAWHQSVAVEMNYSETAFVRSPAGKSILESGGEYDLRWFTPAYEVDLCGHATLATAHTLWSELGEDAETLKFKTRSGTLVASRVDDQIQLDFPSTPPEVKVPEDELIAALGLEASQIVYFGQSRFDAFLQLASEADVLDLTPNFPELAKFNVRGTIVTAQAGNLTRDLAGQKIDFVSRFFAPNAGVDEDPVTGSAHCCLAPFWNERIAIPANRQMVGFQASKRGGLVQVEMCNGRVLLSGRAITVIEGHIAV